MTQYEKIILVWNSKNKEYSAIDIAYIFEQTSNPVLSRVGIYSKQQTKRAFRPLFMRKILHLNGNSKTHLFTSTK